MKKDICGDLCFILFLLILVVNILLEWNIIDIVYFLFMLHSYLSLKILRWKKYH